MTVMHVYVLEYSTLGIYKKGVLPYEDPPLLAQLVHKCCTVWLTAVQVVVQKVCPAGWGE